ncbi:hypothetical protein J8Z28_03850 [Pseudoalteromonas sp. SCSIO 43088]|uniref:hypothetical protein n=1 Tax=Pseudoalteromonas sp. SCSIO 43088 TaxID=2822846 RepID=UPI00202AD5E9|nr:hypothetical protein [Pseudoalteromonas sp. SCSIO 43088]URQ87039.1 hypothetical protein J8Z28_03850 [Pseudoalteromonas sp. SCSIO 43088]
MATKKKIDAQTTSKNPVQTITTTSNESSNKAATETGSIVETHVVLVDGKAAKLSTKKRGFVTFTLATCIDSGELELRLTGNDGGGLHSKEWLSVTAIIDVLNVQVTDKPFKSTVFKSVFKGASANNASFLAAVLRSKDINLIVSTEKSQYLHMLPNNYESVREQLLAKASAK